MDSIISSVGGHQSNVKLAAYGWDAHYFRDTIFESNITISDNQKPTVILGYLGVDQGATLTIKAGVQLFASAQTKIYIAGTLDIQGDCCTTRFNPGRQTRLGPAVSSQPMGWYSYPCG